MQPGNKELARAIELTLVASEAGQRQVEALCAQARELGTHCVCVHGSRVELARTLLEDTEIKVNALIGFPYGADDSDVKRFAVETAIDHGAQELESVLNLGRFKDGEHKYILREFRDLAEAADERPVKIVLQTHLLTREELQAACALVLDSGVEFVSTGTGINSTATTDEVKLLRELVGPKFGIKAAGLAIDSGLAEALVQGGANRLGIYSTLLKQ